MEELKSFEESYMKTGKKAEPKGRGSVAIARLPTLQAGYNNDPRVLMALDELKEANNVLREKVKKLEEKVSLWPSADGRHCENQRLHRGSEAGRRRAEAWGRAKGEGREGRRWLGRSRDVDGVEV